MSELESHHRAAIAAIPETFGLRSSDFTGKRFRVEPTKCYVNDTGELQLVVQVDFPHPDLPGERCWEDFTRTTTKELWAQIVLTPDDVKQYNDKVRERNQIAALSSVAKVVKEQKREHDLIASVRYIANDADLQKHEQSGLGWVTFDGALRLVNALGSNSPYTMAELSEVVYNLRSVGVLEVEEFTFGMGFRLAPQQRSLFAQVARWMELTWTPTAKKELYEVHGLEFTEEQLLVCESSGDELPDGAVVAVRCLVEDTEEMRVEKLYLQMPEGECREYTIACGKSK